MRQKETKLVAWPCSLINLRIWFLWNGPYASPVLNMAAVQREVPAHFLSAQQGTNAELTQSEAGKTR